MKETKDFKLLLILLNQLLKKKYDFNFFSILKGTKHKKNKIKEFIEIFPNFLDFKINLALKDLLISKI